MKLATSLIAFFIISNLTTAQWTQQNSGTSNSLNGVSFINENIGTAVGLYNTILRTTNGGLNWFSQVSATSSNLYGVCFADENNGWAVGDQKLILRTTNGGSSWSSHIIDTVGQWLNNVSFIDEYNGIVVGSSGTILRTTNGGIDWINESINTELVFWAVSMVDTNNAWIVGDAGTILQTTDGGNHWINQASGTSIDLTGVSFVDENYGWAVGVSGTILRTTNGGALWDLQSSGLSSPLYGVSFSDVNNGIAVGGYFSNGDIVLRTTDGGTNWNSQTIGLTTANHEVCFINANHAWVVGSLGIIITLTGVVIQLPNGGEIWQIGNSYDIQWNDNISENVKIELYKGGLYNRNISTSTPSDGLLSWNIPIDVTPSNDYQIKITSINNSGINDFSNGNFTISEPIQIPNFTIEINHPYIETSSFYNRDPLPQNKFVFEISLETANLPNPPLHDLVVNATIDGTPMELILNNSEDSLDSDNDGDIDQFPSSQFPMVPWIKFLAISQAYQSNQFDKNIHVTLTSVNGVQTNFSSEEIATLYFSKNNDGNIFKLDIDAYNFNNPGVLHFREFLDYFNANLENPNVGIILFGILLRQQGQCFGISATSGSYFLYPYLKPLPGTVYSWFWNDVPVRNNIIGAQMSQVSFINTFNYDETIQYQSLISNLSVNDPILLAIKMDGQEGNHAVLATKITKMNNRNKSYVQVYENERSNEAYVAEYDLLGNDFSYNSIFGVHYNKFSSVPKNVYSNWLDLNYSVRSFAFSIQNYLEENNLESFAIGCPANLLITNSLNQKVGYDDIGNYYNEIPNSSIVRAPTGDNLNDSLTIIYVPRSEDYAVEMFGNGNGIMRFESYKPITQLNGSVLFTAIADSINISAMTEAFLNSDNNTLEVDYDGDGEIDTTIALITGNSSCIEVFISEGWNLISIPLDTEQKLKTEIFPTAVSPAFWFNQGYQIRDTLEVKKGYWIKFDQIQSNQICGNKVYDDTISIRTGWNMIGVLDELVPFSRITTIPSGILASNFFGYSSGYFVEDTLKPGSGYWVKSSSNGAIILNSSLNKGVENNFQINSEWASITVTDALSREMKLYISEDVDKELFILPPIPPEGAFDIRYTSDLMIESIKNRSAVINISGAEYPLTIKISGVNLHLSDLISSKLLNETIEDGGKFTIYDTRINKIMIDGSYTNELPVSFALDQNYPNPFNPITIIKFALPKDSEVNLSIYNVLGELVTTLVNEEMKAGYHQVDFNAANLATGVYLYRIKAGEFVQTKKMILMK